MFWARKLARQELKRLTPSNESQSFVNHVRGEGWLGRLPERREPLPVAERLGDIDAGDLVAPVEIGKRAGDPQHAMESARRKRHDLGRLAQKFRPALIGHC